MTSAAIAKLPRRAMRRSVASTPWSLSGATHAPPRFAGPDRHRAHGPVARTTRDRGSEAAGRLLVAPGPAAAERGRDLGLGRAGRDGDDPRELRRAGARREGRGRRSVD